MPPRRILSRLVSTGMVINKMRYSSTTVGVGKNCSTVKMCSRGMASRVLTIDNMNENIKLLEYAVRGPLVIRSVEIEKELKQGVKKPFTEVIKANIGDCHAMGQVPMTFIRQVIALVSYPKLFEDPTFPSDAKERAAALLQECKGSSVGSYSDSAGIELIRRHCAEYITKRDGYESSWENIVLCGGASDGIKNVLKLFINDRGGPKPGVMVPIPQYPLYSATIAEFNMQQVGYYLDEDKNWALDVKELDRAISEATEVCKPQVIVVINPGNPTGQVLTRDNIESIIKFAHKHNLFIFADEVYQYNVYDEDSKFHSFKKVLMEMGEPYCSQELASFMSCSKCYMGECGIRGGYVEILNIDPEVKKMYLKAISAMLCPTVIGQCVMDVVTNPPRPGEPSYEQFEREKNDVLGALKYRAKLVADTFNSFEGFKCNKVQGAMYAFPQITLPPKAIEEAKKAGQQPDAFYAFALLENTGICIVPGSGFGQKPGTYHFRTTILPQTDKLKIMLDKFRVFHEEFYKKYS